MTWTNQEEARGKISEKDLVKLVKDPDDLYRMRSPEVKRYIIDQIVAVRSEIKATIVEG